MVFDSSWPKNYLYQIRNLYVVHRVSNGQGLNKFTERHTHVRTDGQKKVRQTDILNAIYRSFDPGTYSSQHARNEILENK